MAAVCIIPISAPSFTDIVFQMAKRVQQSPDVDSATAAFKRVSLGAPNTHLRTPSGGSPLRPGSVLSSGMAARRNKPLFKLSDITGGQEPGGGAASAGTAAVIPTDAEWPPRRPVAMTGTPFANFGKIVYALLVLGQLLFAHPLVVILPVRSTSVAKQSYILQALTFPMVPPLPSTWINSSLVKSLVTVLTAPSSEFFTNPLMCRWQ